MVPAFPHLHLPLSCCLCLAGLEVTQSELHAGSTLSAGRLLQALRHPSLNLVPHACSASAVGKPTLAAQADPFVLACRKGRVPATRASRGGSEPRPTCRLPWTPATALPSLMRCWSRARPPQRAGSPAFPPGTPDAGANPGPGLMRMVLTTGGGAFTSGTMGVPACSRSRPVLQRCVEPRDACSWLRVSDTAVLEPAMMPPES